MATPYLAKVSSGHINLPADMQRSLGLQADGYLLLRIEGGRLIGDSVPTLVDEDGSTLEERLAAIDRMAGSMPELRGAVEDLLQERAKDRW